MISLADRIAGRVAAPIAKSLDDELDRLDALLSRQEARIRRAFAEFVRDAKSESVVREVRGFLERGEVDSALRVVDGYISRLANVLPEVFRDAAAAEAKALAPKFVSFAPTLGVSFDPTDYEAAELARNARLEFIREFTAKQREATRNALTDSMLDGAGPRQTATAFRDSIGLTDSQRKIVANYRRSLETGSSDALSRELRDRRFDPTVARAIRNGEPPSAAQIDKMVDAYRRRMIQMRAEVIARTEGVRLTAQARREAFRQNLREAGMTEADAQHQWNSIRDNRTRETHRDMNGQVQPFSRPFQSPSGAQLRYPGDPTAPAAETIQCRCHETFKLKPLGVI